MGLLHFIFRHKEFLCGISHCNQVFDSLIRYDVLTKQEVQRRMISVDNFFRIFEIIIFCFVFAIFDLVQNVETIFHISYVLTASGNLF